MTMHTGLARIELLYWHYVRGWSRGTTWLIWRDGGCNKTLAYAIRQSETPGPNN